MRKRWVVALLVLPGVFFPTWYGTYRLMSSKGKTAVRGNVATTFPILVMRAGAVDVVPYASNQWQGAQLRVPDAERANILERLARLPKTGVDRFEDDHIATFADVLPGANGMQRIHVEVHRSRAMGTMMSESWYDTDGVRIVPVYEREYLPTWNALMAMFVAGPLALFIGVMSAARRRPPAPAQPSS